MTLTFHWSAFHTWFALVLNKGLCLLQQKLTICNLGWVNHCGIKICQVSRCSLCNIALIKNCLSRISKNVLIQFNSVYYLATKVVQKSGIYEHWMVVICWLGSLVGYKQEHRKGNISVLKKKHYCTVWWNNYLLCKLWRKLTLWVPLLKSEWKEKRRR